VCEALVSPSYSASPAAFAGRERGWPGPIPGTSKLSRLEENIGAAAIELMSDDLREIESTASKITVQGARYPEHLERMTNR